jgi:ketosteroid isomerase-like protein
MRESEMALDVIPDGISKEAWEEAREAIRSGLRDDRCNVTVRFGMVDQTADGFREAIARAIMAAEARATERAAQKLETIADEFDAQPAWAIYRQAAADLRNTAHNDNFRSIPHGGLVS